MGLQLIRIEKNTEKTLVDVIDNVLIQTTENLYSADATYNKWQNAGIIPDAGVVVKAEKRSKVMVDGQTFNKGWKVSFELTSEQYYSLFEFEKFNNQLCYIVLPNVYLKNFRVNVDMDTTFNEAGEGLVKLSGTKYVKNLRDAFDPNPWGSLGEPWDVADAAGGIDPKPTEGLPGALDPDYSYEYLLRLNDEFIEFVTPAVPDAESDISAVNFTLVDFNTHLPIATLPEPTGIVVTVLVGSVVVTILEEAYALEYTGGVWKLKYTSLTTTFKLGDKITIKFDL